MSRAVRRSNAPKLISPFLALALLWVFAGSVAARGAETADSEGRRPAGPIGYDVSYPQCGGKLPANVAFAIVGVNGGRVFSGNPCLGIGEGDDASQLAWAGREAQLYANTGNPGPRLSQFWPTGQGTPRVCSDDDPDTASCAYNYGWNAAADSYARAVAAYVDLGWAEPDATRTPVANTWWLDVETANSWRSDPMLNVAALHGAVDYLESMQVESVGFYSAPHMWSAITGGTDDFADYPSWVAGASTLQGALDVCRGEGFTGGPVVMAQFFESGFDANVTC
jgi:hypothetical protein